jgi:hypothetical protein
MELPHIDLKAPLDEQLAAALCWISAGREMKDKLLVRLGNQARARILAEQGLVPLSRMPALPTERATTAKRSRTRG